MSDATDKALQGSEEAIDPTVRAILDDVVVADGGPSFVQNYASWAVKLKAVPRNPDGERVFIQLGLLAREFHDAGCAPVARSLADLARIGLLPLARGRGADV